jgi:plastocyanin
MDGSVFYFLGGALVLSALVLAAIGIRGKSSFPPSKSAMAGILGLFALLVAGTAAYAIANASEEQDNRNKERAQEQQAQTEVSGSEAAQGAPAGGQPAKPATASLDLTSPADGQTMFEPGELAASAGVVTLTYDNPSPVTHNLALEDSEGKVLRQSEDVTDGTVALTLNLVPGQYTYFCSIPGHRQAGMEGTLQVK